MRAGENGPSWSASCNAPPCAGSGSGSGTLARRDGEHTERLVEPWGCDKDDVWYLLAGPSAVQRTFRSTDRRGRGDGGGVRAAGLLRAVAAWAGVVEEMERRRSTVTGRPC
ncbi:hypothetical protein [Nonomuraea rubra]|uniref:hypothetical protein n=1 Tax=Nonomuraea rubra TaxID=46180 RepID=UPI0031EE7513